VIGFGVDPRALLSPAELGSLARVDCRYVTLFPLGGRPQGFDASRSAPQGLQELEDFSGELTAWLKKSGLGRGAVAIVRPDKFTYALVAGGELPQTVRRLADDLGISGKRAEAVAA
jgi:3-(3-hydroxy-phenyl)propionate hydroxylase